MNKQGISKGSKFGRREMYGKYIWNDFFYVVFINTHTKKKRKEKKNHKSVVRILLCLADFHFCVYFSAGKNLIKQKCLKTFV